MRSLTAVVLRGLLKTRMDRVNRAVLSAGAPEEQVAVYRRELSIEIGKLVLGDYRVEDSLLGGRPATWIRHDSFPNDRATLFLHGGGYVGGSVYYSRNQAYDIAKAAGQEVVSLDYRLAPENPFPAAVDDVLAAWRDLLGQGYAPEMLTLAGFSAGGGLALAATLAIRENGLPLPGAVVGLSPWCDLTMNQITVKANNGKDIMIPAEFLALAAGLYANGQDRTNPLMSPLYGNLTGFPPLLLQVAAEELLLGEVIAFADKADKSGVAVTLEIFDGMWHVWQSLDEVVPEARAAMERIGEFICERGRRA